MSATKEPPKVFISYSWSGTDHEQFVMELATALRSHGVDAILDKWRLKVGQDKNAFMELMVTDESVVKVLVLCDRKYAEKADSRIGGVGTESQIISQELYSKVDQTKFIPVVCERDEHGEAYLPVFMKARKYVDISSDEAYGAGLEELLRQIYDVPLHPEPLLGKPPTFLNADGGGALPVSPELAGTVRAIRGGRLSGSTVGAIPEVKPSRSGTEMHFVQSVVAEVDRQYVTPDGTQSGYDEEIYQAILRTKQLRDQVSEYADTLAGFSEDDPKAIKTCIVMLEALGQKFGPPLRDGTYQEGWADLYRFFALESVLLITAALIRYERWRCLRALFKHPYVLRQDHAGTKVADITAFDSYMRSIDEHRNNRLRANRASLTADLLKERCSSEYTAFAELVQADFLLALDGVVHAKERQANHYTRYWTPRTGVFTSEAASMPLFLKAVDPDIRRDIRTAVGVKDAADMAQRVLEAKPLLEDFKALAVGRYWGSNFVQATNLQALIKD